MSRTASDGWGQRAGSRGEYSQVPAAESARWRPEPGGLGGGQQAGRGRGASRRTPSQGPRRLGRWTCAVSPGTEGSSPGRPLSTGAKLSSRGRPSVPGGTELARASLESRRLVQTERRHPPRRRGWTAACPGPAVERGTPAGCASALWLAPVTERRAAVGTRPGDLGSHPRAGGRQPGLTPPRAQGRERPRHGGQAQGPSSQCSEGGGQSSVRHARPSAAQPCSPHHAPGPRATKGGPVSSRLSDGDDETWGLSCCCNGDLWGPEGGL